MTLNANPDLALDNVTITTTVSGLKSLFPRYSIIHLMSCREVNKDLPGYALIGFFNERAVDCGGVCRDMLSGFWEETYTKLFDGHGSTLLTPVVLCSVKHA